MMTGIGCMRRSRLGSKVCVEVGGGVGSVGVGCGWGVWVAWCVGRWCRVVQGLSSEGMVCMSMFCADECACVRKPSAYAFVQPALVQKRTQLPHTAPAHMLPHTCSRTHPPAGWLVSNDEMRDHIFQLLGPKYFYKWKQRHQLRYTVGAHMVCAFHG